jgi:N-acetylmuramoyl-L-alanine amidase
LIQFLGLRGASAAMGFLIFALVSSGAAAQTVPAAASLPVQQALPALDVSAAVKAEADGGAAASAVRKYSIAPAAPPATTAAAPASAAAVEKIIPTVSSYSAAPSQSINAIVHAPAALSASAAAPAIAREASWLFRNGWPLYALVDRYGAGAPLDEQAQCMAVAVYFEARGESLEGQLAVARVIMNRAASGRYPPSWCATVKQPWQFSFVNPRTGQLPPVNVNSAAWRKAQAITRLAIANVVPSLSHDVLWYHADYVAPSWGRRLSFVSKIGTHIFYRS